MGSMSASDAAPLPRLGEVYFDVRGESRSMRLSWYADTGVAVFSIWQGGTCTGTFRLPIADLPRMIATLQRGPQGSGGEEPGAAGQRGMQGHAPGPEMLDSEIRTGQNAMPPPRHAEGRAPARHGGGPAAGYADGRPAGDYAEPETGYVGGHAGGRYADEPGSGYGQERSYATSGPARGHQNEPPREYLDPPARDHRS